MSAQILPKDLMVDYHFFPVHSSCVSVMAAAPVKKI